MQKYDFTYKLGGETKTSTVSAANAQSAKKAFLLKNPDVSEDQIVSASNVSSNEDVMDVISSRNDYKTAIVVAKVGSFIGWVIIGIGVLVLLAGLGSRSAMGAFAIAPSLGLVVGGLVLVILGQTSRATVENTNYTRQMLELARKHQG